MAKESVNSFDFNTLYKEYYNYIFNFIKFTLTQSKEVAEEITNDVFLKAMENITYFDCSKGNIKNWLCTIAKRLVIDNTRLMQNRKVSHVEDYQTDEGVTFLEPTDNIDASVNVQCSEMENLINAILSRMSDNAKAIARMKFFEGYSNGEIAEILEIPYNRVTVTINRIREKLEQTLAPNKIVA